jgi:hypothetical protein
LQVIDKGPSHLVTGGWKAGNIALALAMVAVPIVIYFQTGWREPWMMWATLFAAALIVAVVPGLVLWERIAFDTEAGEVHFDQLTATGRNRRAAALKPVSRVELDITPRVSGSGGRAGRRLALVTGHERTPFTKTYSGSRRLDDERDELNAWLESAFGDRWRDGAKRLRETARSGDADVAPQEGISRIRQPATGLSVDVPGDWSAAVRSDRRGQLRLLGVTLLERFDRPGPERHAGDDDDDWNTLIVKGPADTGLKLEIHDGPLLRALEDTLDDPWSRQWGTEVLESTDRIELGGMAGFSITRRIPEGGSTPAFGKVGADVAARQVWLGAESLHAEIVGLARIDDVEMQRAVDAMFASIRLPAASPGRRNAQGPTNT